MASERHGHPDYTPPGPADWQALRERRRRQAHDEAMAEWERISPEFARRRAARAARAAVDEGTPAPGPNPEGEAYRRASDGE